MRVFTLRRMFALTRSPHTVLGLPTSASLDEAKVAYKALVMKFHPDIAKNDPTAEEKFKEITEAYSLLKKHKEKVDELTKSASTEDPDFVSKRPPPPQETQDYRPPYEPTEFINFKPLQIKLPENDRLGLNYKPFFNDKDAVHPKAGTITILVTCFFLVSVVSAVMYSLEERDYEVNELLYQRLTRKYESKEWNRSEVFPALQVFQKDPEYAKYVAKRLEVDRKAKFSAFLYESEGVERFSILKAAQKPQ